MSVSPQSNRAPRSSTSILSILATGASLIITWWIVVYADIMRAESVLSRCYGRRAAETQEAGKNPCTPRPLTLLTSRWLTLPLTAGMLVPYCHSHGITDVWPPWQPWLSSEKCLLSLFPLLLLGGYHLSNIWLWLIVISVRLRTTAGLM